MRDINVLAGYSYDDLSDVIHWMSSFYVANQKDISAQLKSFKNVNASEWYSIQTVEVDADLLVSYSWAVHLWFF